MNSIVRIPVHRTAMAAVTAKHCLAGNGEAVTICHAILTENVQAGSVLLKTVNRHSAAAAWNAEWSRVEVVVAGSTEVEAVDLPVAVENRMEEEGPTGHNFTNFVQ